MSRCPTCNSPQPHRHPALAFEGEVEVCADEFHLQETPQNTDAYRQLVREKRLHAAAHIQEYGQ